MAMLLKPCSDGLFLPPKYAKEAKAFYRGKGNYAQLTKAQTKFSNSLKASTINPYEYLFITLPKIFGHASFGDSLLKDIKQTKVSYDAAKDNLIDGLTVDLLDIFSPNAVAGVSITSAISDWYSALKDQTKAHVFDGCGALLMAPNLKGLSRRERLGYITCKTCYGITN